MRSWPHRLRGFAERQTSVHDFLTHGALTWLVILAVLLLYIWLIRDDGPVNWAFFDIF